jgi:hypothetical protein
MISLNVSIYLIAAAFAIALELYFIFPLHCLFFGFCFLFPDIGFNPPQDLTSNFFIG